MARRSDQPIAPRASPPELPARWEEDGAGLAPRADLTGVLLSGVTGDPSALHGRIAESRIDGLVCGRWELGGASLVDVEILDVRAIEVGLRDGTWRSVELRGGRIGTLDAPRTAWDGVTVRGVRIDYLSFAAAELTDVSFVDCEIGTLDLPDARLTRVRFTGTRADEVGTRGLRARDLDLRGLETLAYTDPRALSGAWLDAGQAEAHATSFAEALGIRVAS
ncbi:hypothetical protein [Microbacterium sp.]|uniref:hypothetical protein n=1 Tax=Microbacterium sp. TaxID=51671 RepID=UPI0025CD9365|nr:hypothetical protein [Microbacterium sp.]